MLNLHKIFVLKTSESFGFASYNPVFLVILKYIISYFLRKFYMNLQESAFFKKVRSCKEPHLCISTTAALFYFYPILSGTFSPRECLNFSSAARISSMFITKAVIIQIPQAPIRIPAVDAGIPVPAKRISATM